MLSMFSYVSGLSLCPPWRSVCSSPFPFFNLVACLLGVESCEFFIYFGDQALSEVSLANMFSHIVGSLFILMLFSLAMQKLFNLMRSHLFILSFMSLALGDISVKMLLHGMSEFFLLMFSSRTFMVHDDFLAPQDIKNIFSL